MRDLATWYIALVTASAVLRALAGNTGCLVPLVSMASLIVGLVLAFTIIGASTGLVLAFVLIVVLCALAADTADTSS